MRRRLQDVWHRKACLLLLLLPLATGAARVSTTVALNRKGQGRVVMDITTDLDRITSAAEPLVGKTGRGLLESQLTASACGLKEVLEREGFTEITITQSVKKNLQTTKVTARINDLRALTGYGGELTFTETASSLLELKGSLGGILSSKSLAAKRPASLPLKDVKVTLTISFPGTVRLPTHPAGQVSHTGRAVSYRWRADRLLAVPTDVHVGVVPDIEGTPNFWLALILGVTGLVILGAVIVLQHGREALKTGSEK